MMRSVGRWYGLKHHRFFVSEARTTRHPPKSFQRMKADSSRLTDALKGKLSSSLTLDDCFHVLERWMEISKRERGTTRSADQAHHLLQAMESHVDTNGNLAIKPSTSFYDVVLQAYAVSAGGEAAAETAERILDRMIDRRKGLGNGISYAPNPTTKTFNIVMNCWKQSKLLNAGVRAEGVLDKMKRWSDDCKRCSAPRCYPNDVTKTTLISTWAASGHKDAPERAMWIFRHAVDSAMNGEGSLRRPIFHAAMSAWMNRPLEALGECEKMISLMNGLSSDFPECAPDTRTYSIVLRACSQRERIIRDGTSAVRGEAILRKMIEGYSAGQCSAPDKFCFSHCTNAWANSDHPEAAFKAESLLLLQREICKESQDSRLRPDVEGLNTVLSAWARSGELKASGKISDLIEQFKAYASPDIVSNNILLQRLGKEMESDKARTLFKGMTLKDKRSYDAFLRSLQNDTSSTGEEVISVLKEMKSLEGIRPDILTYTFALDAIPNGPNDPFPFVEVLWAEMTKDSLSRKLDSYALVSLIKALAKSRTLTSRRKGFDIIVDVFRQVDSGDFSVPEEVAFFTALQAIKDIGDSDEKIREGTSMIIETCKRSGLLSRRIMDSVEDGIIGCSPDKLLPEWSSRLPKAKRPTISHKE